MRVECEIDVASCGQSECNRNETCQDKILRKTQAGDWNERFERSRRIESESEEVELSIWIWLREGHSFEGSESE